MREPPAQAWLKDCHYVGLLVVVVIEGVIVEVAGDSEATHKHIVFGSFFANG